MPVRSIYIPQLGEGLQEVLLLGFLKHPGEKVSRDEPLYEMETDKAAIVVESPYTGSIIEWTCKEGEILSIGSVIAKMEVAETVLFEEEPCSLEVREPSKTLSASGVLDTVVHPKEIRNAKFSPRVRQYLKEKGLLDYFHLIPVKGKKLTTEDVDAYQAAQRSPLENGASAGKAAIQSAGVGNDYEEIELSQRQRTLNYRLSKGQQLSVPATITAEVKYNAIEKAKNNVKEKRGLVHPSALTMIAWCVVQSMRSHPKFRSTVLNGALLRIYNRVNLGIAVALPQDELGTAVVTHAEQLSWRGFTKAIRSQIKKTLSGQDQATETTTLFITDMSSFGISHAIPVIVPPAIATLFIGETYLQAVPANSGVSFEPMVSFALTFDHSAINGVGASNFLNEVKQRVETFILPE